MTKITITGDLGSGKSAVSKILCARTGYNYISTGQIQRNLALEMGIDTLAMNRRADTDPSIDERIDGIFIALGDDPKAFVVDSRMAWFFLPNSFKIYLQTDLQISATRILNDPDGNSEQYETIDEAMNKIKTRKERESARFLTKYNADCANMNNFDVVINTNTRSPEMVAELILNFLTLQVEGTYIPRYQ